LKDRIASIAGGLRGHLPPDFDAALRIVVSVARAEPPIDGWAAWPLCTFVELFGVDHPESSLPAMEHLTMRASCEFAIRPFLQHHLDAAYEQLVSFTASSDENVRRLASEGTRPRLPWGKAVPVLVENPHLGLALLERLRHDPSEMVRRSVGNHLNDLSKTHPDLVTSTIRSWLAEQPAVERKMAEHGLRTLVKQGSTDALQILGFSSTPDVVIEEFEVFPRVVPVGGSITLTLAVRSLGRSAQHLMIDFVVHHINADGSTSPKVFKWTKLELEPRVVVQLRKRRPIRSGTTRTYRPGFHRVELQVGGQVLAESGFDIEER
jgi:3-methyladenine DNA glycosylase AlkC